MHMGECYTKADLSLLLWKIHELPWCQVHFLTREIIESTGALAPYEIEK